MDARELFEEYRESQVHWLGVKLFERLFNAIPDATTQPEAKSSKGRARLSHRSA